MDVQFTAIKEVEFNYSQADFWDAVQVWISKPHTLNKRVLSFEEVAKFRSANISIINHIKDIVHKDVNVVKAIQDYKESIMDSKQIMNDQSLLVTFRKLIPRNSTHFDSCVEMVLTDVSSMKVVFINLSPHQCKPSISCIFPYMIHLNENKVYLKIETQYTSPLCDKPTSNTTQPREKIESSITNKECTCEPYRSKTIGWLQDTLLPKLIKWAGNSTKNVCSSSLQLIDNMSLYFSQYNELKLKYGKEITEIWPEVTDPSKFVYEDLAIAAYLMLLWQKPGTSFVDLGCGNGLLVHILNSEGHEGFGVDVRKRKIWDLYPSSTVLKVETISPSSSALFPHTEWIIGNHSDELTPWIPVIAARSHRDCKMFLLPCCAYQFNGRKYQRRNSKLSIYNDYLNYIAQDVCKSLCEFSIEMDRLRIPSTKRIAIVCRSRQYTTEEEYKKVDSKIETFLKRLEHVDNETQSKDEEIDTSHNDNNGRDQEKEIVSSDENILKHNKDERLHEIDGGISSKDNSSVNNDVEVTQKRGVEEHPHEAKRLKMDPKEEGSWMKNIKTRDVTETVKNCTQIDKSIVQTIASIIIESLLTKQLARNSSWNDDNDYQIPLGEIIRDVKSKDEKLLSELSKQNGGIKTLMRNKHDIFLVMKDSVQFRKPTERARNDHWKSKPCWFQRNHPFQCPLSDEQCGFVH